MILARRLAILFAITFCLFAPRSAAQVPALNCEMYEDMIDFLERANPPFESLGQVKDQSERYILFKKFKHPESGKKDNKAKYAWALIHDSTAYLNLAFSNSVYQKMAFLKLDVVGRYCASVITQDERWLSWRSETMFSSGLIGKAIKESGGIHFKDSAGVAHRILLVDTKEIFTEPFSGNTGGMGDYLTYEKLAAMVNKAPNLSFEKDVYQLGFEEVMALLSKINHCYLEAQAP